VIETVVVQGTPVKRDRWYWWLMSGDDYSAPVSNNGFPYRPNVKNQTLRNILWWLRNPLGNFFGQVIGVQGVVRSVTGPAPALAVTYADTTPPQRGWKWAVTRIGWLYLPFISYYGVCEFYFGWRPHDGAIGFKLVNASRGEG